MKESILVPLIIGSILAGVVFLVLLSKVLIMSFDSNNTSPFEMDEQGRRIDWTPRPPFAPGREGTRAYLSKPLKQRWAEGRRFRRSERV